MQVGCGMFHFQAFTRFKRWSSHYLQLYLDFVNIVCITSKYITSKYSFPALTNHAMEISTSVVLYEHTFDVLYHTRNVYNYIHFSCTELMTTPNIHGEYKVKQRQIRPTYADTTVVLHALHHPGQMFSKPSIRQSIHGYAFLIPEPALLFYGAHFS